MNGTQFLDRALMPNDDIAGTSDERHTSAKATLQKEATRLKKRAEFLYVLAAVLPEDMSILGPKAYDALMQFVVEASR